MDSDSDLQAYINELSRKTHDLKYVDHESTSSDEPEPSHSSYVEVAVKKTNQGTDAENIEKQSAQSNKVKELEEKYLKKALKSKEPNLSSSFSEYNPELEEKLNTDNIHTFPDETTIDSSAKPNENKNIKTTQNKETLGSIDNNRGKRQIENLKSHSFEEDIKEDSYLASQNSSQRKLSDNSSLLNKSSIFYSKNDKAGRQKPTGKVIFRMRSSTLSESDTIKSDVTTSSVSEEIPELMQNETKETTKSNRLPVEDNDESNNYEENTFENSEASSTIKTKSSSSKSTSESVLAQKSCSKSSSESAVSERASSEMLDRDDNISETVTSSKRHSSTSSTEETKESPSNTEKSDDVISQDDSTQSSTSGKSQEDCSVINQDSIQSTSVKSQEDHSSSNKSSSTTRESNESSIQYNHQKVKKGHHKSKNNIKEETTESLRKPNRSRVKDNKKEKRENNISKKRSKMEKDFSSSPSSLETSVVTSSTTSSFYVKMKKKKYRERKRKMKQEKELTELIIKLLIKNLPMILRQTMGINSTAELLHQQPRTFICHHCGGNSIGFDRTQKRIDDALRQTVDLTKQFLESQKTMIETQYSHLNSNYNYTTLKNYST